MQTPHDNRVILGACHKACLVKAQVQHRLAMLTQLTHALARLQAPNSRGSVTAARDDFVIVELEAQHRARVSGELLDTAVVLEVPYLRERRQPQGEQ